MVNVAEGTSDISTILGEHRAEDTSEDLEPVEDEQDDVMPEDDNIEDDVEAEDMEDDVPDDFPMTNLNLMMLPMSL